VSIDPRLWFFHALPYASEWDHARFGSLVLPASLQGWGSRTLFPYRIAAVTVPFSWTALNDKGVFAVVDSDGKDIEGFVGESEEEKEEANWIAGMGNGGDGAGRTRHWQRM
jgi:hypothetical protein